MKFILLEEVTFQENHAIGFGLLSSTKIVDIVIPKDSELVVTEVTGVALEFKFSNGYEIVTTFEKLEELTNSGSLKKIGIEALPFQNDQKRSEKIFTHRLTKDHEIRDKQTEGTLCTIETRPLIGGWGNSFSCLIQITYQDGVVENLYTHIPDEFEEI